MEWDKWVPALGGRYDYATASMLTRSGNTLTEVDDQRFTRRGGINYLLDNEISPYFNYSESFELTSGSTKKGKPSDLLRSKQYEADVKCMSKGIPVVLTTAVY